jgi:hypothetical protein
VKVIIASIRILTIYLAPPPGILRDIDTQDFYNFGRPGAPLIFPSQTTSETNPKIANVPGVQSLRRGRLDLMNAGKNRMNASEGS